MLTAYSPACSQHAWLNVISTLESGSGNGYLDCVKKNARVFRKIKNVRGLSVDEKWLFAKTLAATPDERWQMLRNHLRSLGLLTRSAQKKHGLFWSE